MLMAITTKRHFRYRNVSVGFIELKIIGGSGMSFSGSGRDLTLYFGLEIFGYIKKSRLSTKSSGFS
jgi:hypothetical protein